MVAIREGLFEIQTNAAKLFRVLLSLVIFQLR